MHQLLVHDPSIASSVITSRFVDDLKREIRSIVMVHRPHNLDTASSLALLQEEALMEPTSREARRNDYSHATKDILLMVPGYLKV